MSIPHGPSLLSLGFSAFSNLLGAALAPERCSACDEPVEIGRAFCVSCASTVERMGDLDDDLVAFASYGGALVTAIHKLKYQDRPDLARPLGDLLAQGAMGSFERWRAQGVDGVIPIPVSPERLAERQYNQATLLANRAARVWRVPVMASAIERTRDTGHQARLSQEERGSNLIGAFKARAASEVSGRRWVLLDDVTTTGSTLAAAKDALESVGAEVIGAVVLCATPRYLAR